RRPEAYASSSIGVLADRALAQRPGGDRHGLFASVLARRRLASPFTGELAYTHQSWDSKLAYSPGLIAQVRAQKTGVARASLTWTLSRNQSIQLEARQVRNRENISIFQYNNRQLQLSWQWQGP
ncbi:MAG TPA: tetratricopeptide repeat protein, partial [Telluria sp.]|nr:tetratricopeptide repeat protein [Telluria sp.]